MSKEDHLNMKGQRCPWQAVESARTNAHRRWSSHEAIQLVDDVLSMVGKVRMIDMGGMRAIGEEVKHSNPSFWPQFGDDSGSDVVRVGIRVIIATCEIFESIDQNESGCNAC